MLLFLDCCHASERKLSTWHIFLRSLKACSRPVWQSTANCVWRPPQQLPVTCRLQARAPVRLLLPVFPAYSCWQPVGRCDV